MSIQPYSIFVADPQRDGPYEQRTKFTTNTQNDALYQTDKIFKEGKMVSTEYTKGHGSSDSCASLFLCSCLYITLFPTSFLSFSTCGSLIALVFRNLCTFRSPVVSTAAAAAST